MKFDYVFIAVSIACGSTLTFARSIQPPQPDLATRYAPDIESFDARDSFDTQIDARDFADLVEDRDDDDDMMELFERSVSADHVCNL